MILKSIDFWNIKVPIYYFLHALCYNFWCQHFTAYFSEIRIPTFQKNKLSTGCRQLTIDPSSFPSMNGAAKRTDITNFWTPRPGHITTKFLIETWEICQKDSFSFELLGKYVPEVRNYFIYSLLLSRIVWIFP